MSTVFSTFFSGKIALFFLPFFLAVFLVRLPAGGLLRFLLRLDLLLRADINDDHVGDRGDGYDGEYHIPLHEAMPPFLVLYRIYIIFPKIVNPCTAAGHLSDEICKELNCEPIPIFKCGSHDTASAVAAVPAPEDAEWAYLSAGTWALLGAEIDNPVITEASEKENITNEGGVGYIRYLKNIMGMWINNQCMKNKTLSFGDIERLVRASTYNEVFDVNDQSLNAPEDMELAIKELLKHNPPKDDGDLFRSIYRSLATSYKIASEQLEDNLDKKFNYIYIVGGGAKNKYLNNLVEVYTHKKVVALPIEATSIGNIKIQIKAMQLT